MVDAELSQRFGGAWDDPRNSTVRRVRWNHPPMLGTGRRLRYFPELLLISLKLSRQQLHKSLC